MDSIRQRLSSLQKTFSFEIFPPKTLDGEEQLFKHLTDLKLLAPDFISVTMGAMGSNQRNTFEIVKRIEKEHCITGVAHLTCIAADQEKIKKSLQELQDKEIRHILCLRGDPPQNASHSFSSDFHYASDLVQFIRKQTGDYFSIGVAGYPEGHIENPSKEDDLLNLKKKVDAGAEYIITQLFFRNEDYFSFVGRARKIGIQVPIIPGIMPVTSFSQLQTFTKVCGAKIPDKMHRDLLLIKDKPERVQDYGIDYAIQQCENLLKKDVPGLHFYILNQAGPVRKIYESLHLPMEG